jgi:hypothetical protein
MLKAAHIAVLLGRDLDYGLNQRLPPTAQKLCAFLGIYATASARSSGAVQPCRAVAMDETREPAGVPGCD